MNMENTDMIMNYFKAKFGHPMEYVGLMKSIAVGSLHIKDVFPLCILNISTSQTFKSVTSSELLRMFPKDIVNFGSDFTIHSLMKNYNNGKDVMNKVCSINDMVILLESKSGRGKDRLLGAFSESLTDGHYSYSDFSSNIEWNTGRYSLCSNITIEKYNTMQDELIQTTFDERMLKFFYLMSQKGWNEFNSDRDNRFLMKPPKIKILQGIKP